MLTTKKLIEHVGEEYAPMIKKVNIPDFYKCIAQVSGLGIQYVNDDVIEEYLTYWAKNKKYIFDFLGDIRVDLPYDYADPTASFENKYGEIGKKYPSYYLWLKMFKTVKENKIQDIDTTNANDSDIRHAIGNVSYCGMSLTHFFKKYLQAPDELVTEIGKAFENQTVSATFTISIDPIDMMLASENPYDWTSCYRLETDFYDSHADGCIAAILDSSSIITYIWNNHGKLDLYENYTLKDVRYKRMRMWIAVAEDFKEIYFNTIYPGKGGYPNSLTQNIRKVVEDYIARKLEVQNNTWVRDEEHYVQRFMDYGYREFDLNTFFKLKGTEGSYLRVYTVPIKCPCGCGNNLIPSDGYDDEYEYNGGGLLYEKS